MLSCGWFVGLPLVENWLVPQHNSNARHYFDQTHAHHGFRHIGSDSRGNCSCSLTHYVGPAGADPAQVFTGPGLTLKPWPPASVGDTTPWDYLLEGTGNTGQTGYCMIDVSRYQHSSEPDGPWSLSGRQRAAFRAGKLNIFALYVGCGADGI